MLMGFLGTGTGLLGFGYVIVPVYLYMFPCLRCFFDALDT